ncbi:MAG: hypothetical protein GY696_24030 [Gammaproteobacteria bacterium]|nr:hypothetical protein [Gammaproteobacteria bacterium]
MKQADTLYPFLKEFLRKCATQPTNHRQRWWVGGGEDDQGTIGPTKGRSEGEESAQGRGGAQPFQTDPELQLSENQQRASSLEITRRQCRPTYRMTLNLIMASGSLLWLMLGVASGYSINFFDCRFPTRIEWCSTHSLQPLRG